MKSKLPEITQPCPSCKKTHTVRHGFNRTKLGRKARLKCQDCGTTFYQEKVEVK